MRGSAGDCDSLVAAAGVAQGGRGYYVPTPRQWSAHPTYLPCIYPVSTEYLLNIYSCFIFRGCWDVIVTLALLCGVPLGGGNLRCALTVDCTPILEHPPKLEIENTDQENILNG